MKFLFPVVFSSLLFSCASTAAPTQDTPAEIPAEPAEVKAEDVSVVSQEDQDSLQEEMEDIDDEPEVIETIYEPIEDIQGYYESDPAPVYMQEASSKPVEEEIEIPIKKESSDSEAKEEKNEVPAAMAEESTSQENKEEPSEDKVEVSLVQKEPERKPEPAPTEKAVLPSKAEQKPVEVAPPVESIPSMPEETAGIEDSVEVESSELLSEEFNAQEAEKEDNKSKLVVEPSRSVSMMNNQYLDIVYPGNGWIYLGEEDNKTAMRYFGRKIGEKNTVFSLRSREEGSTILHFYKNDALTGKFIDDYLLVEIKGTNNTQEHAVAPSYAEIIPQKPEKKVMAKKIPVEEETSVTPVKTGKAPLAAIKPVEKNTSTQKVTSREKTEAYQKPQQKFQDEPEDNGSKTVIQNTSSENKNVPKTENSISSPKEEAKPSVSKESIQNTEDMSSDEILEKARESFKNKKYSDTLAYLDDFFSKATTKIDEGLFIQGQTFESNSPVRNIKSALDTYETIVRRYPQSIHWAKANERITYLRKFYFNIR